MGFTFLCLLRPVSATFYLDGAHFNHKEERERERESANSATLSILIYLTLQPEAVRKDFLSQSFETTNRREIHYNSLQELRSNSK